MCVPASFQRRGYKRCCTDFWQIYLDIFHAFVKFLVGTALPLLTKNLCFQKTLKNNKANIIIIIIRCVCRRQGGTASQCRSTGWRWSLIVWSVNWLISGGDLWLIGWSTDWWKVDWVENLITLFVILCVWIEFCRQSQSSWLQDDGEEKDETKRKSRNLSEKKRRDEFNRLNIDLLQIEQNF